MSQPNCDTTKKFVSNTIEKAEILMNKPVYLGFSVLELNKSLMYECCYGYVKPKYSEKAKLCYMDTDSVIVCIKTADIYKNISKDVENLTWYFKLWIR